MDTSDEKVINDIVETNVLPEAPAVSNIRVWIEGFGVMLTMRGTNVSDIVKQTEYIVEVAKKKGWKHTWDTPVPQPSNNASTGNVGSQGASLETKWCSIHGVSMPKAFSRKTNKPYFMHKENGKACFGGGFQE